MHKEKNLWVLLIFMLAGIVLGGFIGTMAENSGVLTWLNYGQQFGLTQPLVLDLGILVLTFALTIRITIAGIVGLVLAALLYRLF